MFRKLRISRALLPFSAGGYKLYIVFVLIAIHFAACKAQDNKTNSPLQAPHMSSASAPSVGRAVSLPCSSLSGTCQGGSKRISREMLAVLTSGYRRDLLSPWRTTQMTLDNGVSTLHIPNIPKKGLSLAFCCLWARSPLLPCCTAGTSTQVSCKRHQSVLMTFGSCLLGSWTILAMPTLYA